MFFTDKLNNRTSIATSYFGELVIDNPREDSISTVMKQLRRPFHQMQTFTRVPHEIVNIVVGVYEKELCKLMVELMKPCDCTVFAVAQFKKEDKETNFIQRIPFLNLFILWP